MGADQSRSPIEAQLRQDSVASTDLENVPNYVSYTVNRPIGGDEAQQAPLTSSTASTSSRSKLMKTFTKNSTLVVVNEGVKDAAADVEDAELKRLKEIPSFLPIIRASLSGSGGLAKADPDILERLDYRGLLDICQRYENHLRLSSSVVATDQADLARCIRETDKKVHDINKDLAERHKKFAKCAEKLKSVNEMAKSLNRCHLLLNENIERLETLNNMLPAEERLEPFVWTTHDD